MLLQGFCESWPGAASVFMRLPAAQGQCSEGQEGHSAPGAQYNPRSPRGVGSLEEKGAHFISLTGLTGVSLKLS